MRYSCYTRVLAMLALLAFAGACETPPPRPPLPPSESDLDLLRSTKLCDQQESFLKRHPSLSFERRPWGTGKEFRLPSAQSSLKGDESYFFDEDGTLVGALFVFPAGLDLAPYRTLRHTLSLLKPALEFYLTVAKLADRASMEASTLYQTGDEKTTTQYLVLGNLDAPFLLEASFTIDPYVQLFSPYRKDFLDRLRETGNGSADHRLDSQGAEDKEPFVSLQQFARGQTAQLSYCGTRNDAVALDAYKKAGASGFSNKVWQAELHHRLGMALDAKGETDKAKAELLQSLAIRPNSPEVLNNLGTVYKTLGDKANAMTSFEKAVSVRPNYAMARYNLAQLFEATDRKRAITEYETYIALVDGIPEEADRILLAKQRVKDLKR
ncbi:MAG: tetratricopeptide repeat protein [Nitrospiraceae bacterium]